MTEFGAFLMKDYRKRYSIYILSLFTCPFSFIGYFLMAVSQYANFSSLVFGCSYETSSMVKVLICKYAGQISSPTNYELRNDNVSTG